MAVVVLGVLCMSLPPSTPRAKMVALAAAVAVRNTPGQILAGMAVLWAAVAGVKSPVGMVDSAAVVVVVVALLRVRAQGMAEMEAVVVGLIAQPTAPETAAPALFYSSGRRATSHE